MYKNSSYLLDLVPDGTDYTVYTRGSHRTVSIVDDERIEHDHVVIATPPHLAARLLIDKGVEVFVEASKILKKRKINARFWLIGEPDLGNINSVSAKQIKEWECEI